MAKEDLRQAIARLNAALDAQEEQWRQFRDHCRQTLAELGAQLAEPEPEPEPEPEGATAEAEAEPEPAEPQGEPEPEPEPAAPAASPANRRQPRVSQRSRRPLPHEQTVELRANDIDEARKAGADSNADSLTKRRPPATVPIPERAQEAIERFREFARAVDDMVHSNTTPVSNTRFDVVIKNVMLAQRRKCCEAFSAMHERHRRYAQERFDQAEPELRERREARDFWNTDMIGAYDHMRSTFFIENWLDLVEEEVAAAGRPEYWEIIDHGAGIMALERVPAVPGETIFDERMHETTGLVPEGATVLVTHLLRSGYGDHLTDAIIRRAQVKVQVIRAGSPQAEQVVAALARDAENEPQGAAPSAANSEAMAPAARLQRYRRYLYKLRMAATKITHTSRLPLHDAPLHPEVSVLLDELSAKLMKSFLKLPNLGGELGDDEVVEQYQQFRTQRFLTEFLDRLEKQIEELGLENHLGLVGHLALEMDIGRMNIRLGHTVFDPHRHQPADNHGEGFKRVIVSVVKPGYVDLTNNTVIRKATVRTRAATVDEDLY